MRHIAGMAWDLGKAMQKKEEFESARLMDFEFRQRVRATRLLARARDLDEAELVRETSAGNEAHLLEHVTKVTGADPEELTREYGRCLALAREQLIAERGDPTPYRLG